MAEIASAYVTLLPSARGFGSKLNSQVGPEVGRAGTRLGGSLGSSMLKGFIAIGAAVKITQFLGDSLAEARESNKVAALTANVIKTTGGAAKVTAAQVNRLADSLSAKTGIDDEQIASAENLILTFKNVKREGEGVNNIFGRAARAAVDLSASGFGDLSGTSKQLGKALNDPVKGITALTRSGVTFTDQQKKQIKTLVASGHSLKAQKIILREVESQVKGSAEAQVTNSDKARVAMSNLKEQIGKALVPAVDALSGLFANKIAPAISGFITNLSNGTGSAGRFGTFLRENVLPVLQDFAGFIINQVVPAFRDALGNVLAGARSAFDSIAQAIARNRPQLEQLGSVIKKVATFIYTKLYPALYTALGKALPFVGKAIGFVIDVIAFLVKAFNRLKPYVVDAATTVYNSAKKYAQFVAAVIDKVSKVVKFFRDLPGKIRGFLTSLPGDLKKIGGQIIDGLVNGIKGAAHKVEDAVKAIIDKIPKKIRQIMGIASPSKVTTQLGQYIGDGLAKGIAGSSDKVGQAVDKVGKKLKEKLAGIRDQLASARSDFASLVEPIASNFTSGLFDFDTAGAFTANLTSVKGTLTTLLGNFKTLIAEGLKPGFLYQLFQSGGPGLINSLAGLSAADAQAAGALFGDVTSLSNQLGSAVAGSTDKGAALENQTVRLERKLDQLIKHVDKSADRTGEKINSAAGSGHKRGK